MKHYFRITSVMMVLSLLLSIGATAQTQKFPLVKQNSDGSYDQWTVIGTFESFIDTVKNLPTTDEQIQKFVREFFDYLPYSDDYGVIIKIGDENTRELDNDEWEELSQSCIDLLKQKKA